jgi:hypothetical protein
MRLAVTPKPAWTGVGTWLHRRRRCRVLPVLVAAVAESR